MRMALSKQSGTGKKAKLSALVMAAMAAARIEMLANQMRREWPVENILSKTVALAQ